MAKEIKQILLQGMEHHKGVDILIGFTDMTSESMKEAMHHHLVDGCAVDVSCALSGALKSNFSRDLKKLNKVASEINQYFELNYRKMIPVNNQLTDN